MPNKVAVFTVTLHRDGISLPWGFRLSGGCDLDYPLVVTKVIVGSPSDGVLQKGDVFRKIANYDARDVRHSDALNLFKNAGSSVSIVIEREVPYDPIENHQSRNALPFIPQPPIPGAVATPFTVAGLPHYEGTQQHPRNNLCRFPPSLIEPGRPDRERLTNSTPHRLEVEQEQELVTEQPYRTTPLVLPGAKATKDPAPTMSYLRHHPNPMMRSSPSHYEWIPIDIAKKQQLADTILERNIGHDKPNRKIVTKPYNTPIGLYSEQNIANTLNSQTGFTPNGPTVVYNPPKNTRLRKTVVYDPSKSETFKALQEAEHGNHVQEVSVPVTPRVFSPVKTPNKLAPPTSYNYNPNRASPQPHPTAPHPKIDYGVSPEEIHQSHSFKRLMNSVMTEY